VIVAYALVIAGAAAAAYCAFIRFVRDINDKAFDAQIDKLVSAANVERANKLCAAAPKSVHVAISKAAIEEALAIQGEKDPPGDSMIRERLLDAYRATEKQQLAVLQPVSWVVMVAIALAGAGGVMALSGEGPIPAAPIVIGGVAILLSVWAWRGAIKIATAAGTRREPLVDMLAKWLS
jgi:hypothetical protein